MPTQILIRSQDRQNYSNDSPSQFRIELSSSIAANKCMVNDHGVKHPTKVKLISCMIGNTYNNVNTTNNVIIVNGTKYSVPVGNYSLTDFITALQNLLIVSNPSMVITFNSLTSNITISNNAPFTLDLTQSYIYQLLGFQNETFSGSSSYTGKFTPTIDYLCLFINMSIGGFVDTSNQFGNKVTFVIQNNSNKDGYITFNCKTQYSAPTRIHHQISNTINISLLDSNNNILQNASEWYMLLSIDN